MTQSSATKSSEQSTSKDSIRPFTVNVSESDLDDLRTRLAMTRFPTKELVSDRSQGVQLATVQELAHYWAEDYDFGRIEGRLNSLPQFTTEIDGVDIHFNFLAGAIGITDQLPAESEEERAAHDAVKTFTTNGFAYFLEQSTRPQTIGYSLVDSPVGLAAWLLDHDTDSYYKISRAFVDRRPVGHLTRESIVDNITLYWLTGTGASAARWYWEFGQAQATAAGQAPPPVSVPVGFTTFPGEIWAAPRSWVETVYPGLAYFNEVDRGGHFAAWEQPELFAAELRAAFASLR